MRRREQETERRGTDSAAQGALTRSAAWGVAAVIGLAWCAPVAAQLHTHAPDANTIYLYHFDEAAGASSAANAGSAGFSAISYDGDPYAGDGVDQPTVTGVLGATGFSGFGNAANLGTTNDLGLGVDVSGNGGFRLDDNDPISDDSQANHSSIFGAGNAFTLEAMVNIPAINDTLNRHIISTDNASGNDTRGFQFRINGTGNLEFNYIGVNVSAVSAPIPTTGPHAFVPNEWFHAAVSYDGANARFYWTRVDPSFSEANLIGGPVAEGVDVTDRMLLAIGNEGRVVGTTGSTESLRGLIDEVRISNKSRTAQDFIFGVLLLPCDVDGGGCGISDFNIIRANLFNTGMTRAQGDLTGDGIVDFGDYRIWKDAVAPGLAASVSLFGSVPEPSTGGLLAGACMLWAAACRPRGSRRRVT